MHSLDSIINSLEETIILFDRSLKITYLNKTGEELFQKSSKDILGKKLPEIIRDNDPISPLIEKVIAEGRSFRVKSAAISTGRMINIDFNLSPFFVSSKIEGAVLSISRNINITEEEDYSFDSIDYLLGSIAHEIKNPLGGIKGAAQLLRNNTQSACIDEYVDMIIKETDRLNLILQDYLTACKKPSLNALNVHEVMEKALTIMNPTIKKAGISLKRVYDPSLPQIIGDEGKLLQVFLNIVKNAVESMKKGGRLEVSTYPSDELFKENGKIKRMALISIKDSGKGISENDMKKIFLPFFTKKKYGSGIGLALSKKILRDHKGFIKVKSQKNKGTCFHVYVPFEK
jgi:two-component system, NtrC family, nitrogen regulation sensor histidine kinase GlnL